MADDDEVAEAYLEQNGDRPQRSTPPQLEDVDYAASLLMVIANRVDMLIAVMAEGYTPQPLPWPVSAVDRVRKRREQAAISSLNAEVYAAMGRYRQLNEGVGHGQRN